MNVFISWSGPRAQKVALALREWLPYVLHEVEPWMSASDIEPGARWNVEITKQLECTNFGIICLTNETKFAPWLLFEAGALAKSIDASKVCPYLIDIEPTDVSGPLAQFQAKKATKKDTWEIVHAIYRSSENQALNETQLSKVFERFWPDLEDALKQIPLSHLKSSQVRSDREILEEVLLAVRGLSLPTSSSRKPVPAIAGDWAYFMIDISEMTGHSQSLMEYRFKPDTTTLQDLLNTLYFDFMHAHVEAMTYGTDWTLVDPQGDEIRKLAVTDRRPLKILGYESGTVFTVKSIRSHLTLK